MHVLYGYKHSSDPNSCNPIIMATTSAVIAAACVVVAVLLSYGAVAAPVAPRSLSTVPTGPVDPVTVFELGEAGYYCMKVLPTVKRCLLSRT